MYVDHAEKKISKLQEAYLRKYLPQEYARFTEASRRAQDVPTKGFGGKMSTLFRGRREDLQDPEPAKPAPSEEGISINVHGFQVVLLNKVPELVSDDDFRMAVSRLNNSRLLRAEDLGDGYDVSNLL